MKRQNYRMVSWWITWPDLNWPNPDNSDNIRRRADQMSSAGVNAATVFGAHFRWDFMPIWELLHDYMAAVGEELHQRGIKFFDHHSAVLIHRYDNREEMRNVMMHSGPHLPFSPSRQAAASWEFRGKRLNNWRMRDCRTGNILYLPQYAAEEFCYNNPEFVESYLEYVKILISETKIDGLMCDDAVNFMGYLSCGCDCCRTAFKKRFDMKLPEPTDYSFWGNWDNPAWRGWIDMRYENNGSFLEKVRSVLPENFPMMSCCSGSSSPNCNNCGQDVRQFNRGCDLVHLEISGNTPPYRHDDKTWNLTVGEKMVKSLHHLAAARRKGFRCIGQGYGFTEPAAGIIWALNKTLASDCWFSTLKGRLGLPDSILATLPDDATPASKAFHFEKDHPGLFSGSPVFQVGVYFSYETRNHTCYGNMMNGCTRDYADTLCKLFANGITAGAVLEMPEDTSEYPLILLPSAVTLTEEEYARLRRFAGAGGIVLATGPFGLPGSGMDWELPMKCSGGFWEWDWLGAEIPPPSNPKIWHEPEKGIFWNPGRIQDGTLIESLLEKILSHLRPFPVSVLKAKGFYTLFHRNEDTGDILLHFLAAEYDTDIDHELDRIRYHRSRVNLITKVAPMGTDGMIELATNLEAEAFSPLTAGVPELSVSGGIVSVKLPVNCCYAIVRLASKTRI